MRSEKEVSIIKKTYKPGIRVKLLKMDDFQSPPIGTEGTVIGVDDLGLIRIDWDTGSRLSIIPGEDEIEIV